MILTIIVFGLSILLLSVYTFKGVTLNKQVKLSDINIMNTIQSMDETAASSSVEKLAEMYNTRAELDEKIVEFHSNLYKLAVITVIIGCIAILAAFILKTPV